MFRYSAYGPANDPGPDYWLRIGKEMAANFNGRLRDECLNDTLFFSIDDARRKLEASKASILTL